MPEDKPQADIALQSDTKYILQSKKMDLEAGWVGRFIGTGKNAHYNLTFLFVAMLFLLVSIPLALPSAERVDVVKIVVPVVTLALGFLFGKGTRE